jgi:hypothetical protein
MQSDKNFAFGHLLYPAFQNIQLDFYAVYRVSRLTAGQF